MTTLIDTHCHLNFNRYDKDRPTIIQRAHDADVHHIIIPAIDLETCHEAIQLADEYDEIYCAVGFHPNSTADWNDKNIQVLRNLANHEKILSIGEIGLDYYWDKSPKHIQAKVFEAQLELASELELPVIIHNREASADVLSILENWTTTLPTSLQDRPGVLHSFSAPMDIAKRALDIGFYLGFTGPVTFKKAQDLRNVVAETPLDRILVETDGPFLTPEPYRGKRNEPSYIPYIVEKIAEVKNLPIDEVGQATTENAKRLFQF